MSLRFYRGDKTTRDNYSKILPPPNLFKYDLALIYFIICHNFGHANEIGVVLYGVSVGGGKKTIEKYNKNTHYNFYMNKK